MDRGGEMFELAIELDGKFHAAGEAFLCVASCFLCLCGKITTEVQRSQRFTENSSSLSVLLRERNMMRHEQLC